MTRVAQLVADVLEEGTFDATPAQALKWLTRRQRTMCARARSYRKKIEVGPTVAGQQTYAVPAEVLEIKEVQVAGVRFGTGRHSDIPDSTQGYLWLNRIGGSGIAMREDSSTGETLLALYPVPQEAGLTVTVLGVCEPPDLDEGDDTTLVIPPTMEDALVDGAIATGMLRLEQRPDLATPFEAIFNAACEELTSSTGRRFRGSGPAQIRVSGVNA